jgi:hypothetical protein
LLPLALACVLASGCSRAESTPAPDPAPPPASPAAPKAPASGAGGSGAPLVLARGIRFVKPSAENDVAKLVMAERVRAADDGRDLVVYVGAKWCEPCQRFHEAAKRGELDADFPELTILEFDLDEDRERINAAGYSSKLIPLFVLPGADGRGTERRFEGGVKGDGAVAQLAPRLRKLLAK